jgi:hypothetical protein
MTTDDATTIRTRPDLAPYMLAAIDTARRLNAGEEFDTDGRLHEPEDALLAVIPGEKWATPETLAAVREITGRPIAPIDYWYSAPGCQAILRRWALG